MRFRHKAAALGATGALVIGAVAVPALAQDGDETSTGQTSTGETTTAETTDIEERRDELQSRLAEALAAELDLPVQEVEAALETVHEQFREERQERRLAGLEERLEAAVDEGSLTQQQADAILDAADAGVFPGRPGHRGAGALRGAGGV